MFFHSFLQSVEGFPTLHKSWLDGQALFIMGYSLFEALRLLAEPAKVKWGFVIVGSSLVSLRQIYLHSSYLPF